MPILVLVMKTTTKFYEFHQNNSGGHFWLTDTIAHKTFIEATSPEEANMKAIKLGIYFDGVSAGTDCGCCGDRFYRVRGTDEGCSIKAIKFSQWDSKGDTIAIHPLKGRMKVLVKE